MEVRALGVLLWTGLLFGLLQAAPASGASIQIDFSGAIETVSTMGPPITTIGVGTPFSGSFIFDDEAPSGMFSPNILSFDLVTGDTAFRSDAGSGSVMTFAGVSAVSDGSSGSLTARFLRGRGFVSMSQMLTVTDPSGLVIGSSQLDAIDLGALVIPGGPLTATSLLSFQFPTQDPADPSRLVVASFSGSGRVTQLVATALDGVVPVPEPSSLGLLAAGLACIGAAATRRARRSATR